MSKIYYSNDYDGILSDPFFSKVNLFFKDSFHNKQDFMPFVENAKTAYPMDVTLTDEALIFEFPIVKAKSDDIEITKTVDTLRIKYQRSDKDENVKFIKRGIVRKDFDFVWKIPNGFDRNGITSQFENGLLTINIPKSAEIKPEKVEILNINK